MKKGLRVKNILKRRDFLKISSGTAAAVAGVSCMPGTLGALGMQDIKGSKEFVGTICDMCSSGCQVEGKVVEGKNVFIQGNRYSEPMGGSVCARGAAGHSQLYDNQRIVTPLIRTGKRGEGKWREASWEEALDLVANNFNKIKKENGPQSVVFTSKMGDRHSHMTAFASAYGSPNIFSHMSTCPITYSTVHMTTFGKILKQDYDHSKYILQFGHNLFEGIDIVLTRKLAKAVGNEACKIVVLDPRFSVMASKADEWFAVKPGTDLAFILALIHVWLRDDTYDKEYVEKYSIGIEKLIESTKDTTPEWQEELTGIPVQNVERIAKEIYAAAPHCIIDWGHRGTTSLAEFQKTKAVTISNILMGSIERKGGAYFAKDAATVNAFANQEIAPSIDNPHAFIKHAGTLRIDGASEQGDNQFISNVHGSLTDLAKNIIAKKPYEIKGMFSIRHNPVFTVANTNEMRKAMHTLEFIVVSDIYMSETALMADIILPESTYLEREEGIEDASGKAPAYKMRNRVVDPINGTMSNVEIFRTLAYKMGLDNKYNWKNLTEFRVKQAKGNMELLTELVRKGYANSNIPPLLALEKKYIDAFIKKYPSAKCNLDEDGLYSSFMKMKTPSGKMEIFSQSIEDQFPGAGVPGIDEMELAHGYPYILLSGKTAIHTNAHTHNVPFLNMLMSDNPVWIHPETAAKEGLKDGDKIIIESAVAKEKGSVMITEGIRPDSLFVYFGFGRESQDLKRANGKGTNQSKILPSIKGRISSTMITNVGVRIKKAQGVNDA